MAIEREDAKAFIGRLQKMVMEAPDSAAALAALPHIFDPNFKLVLDGQELGLDWLEEHVQQLHKRLDKVTVDVTHAVREGSVLMERHVISGTDVVTKAPWVMEVMAAYELTSDDKILTHYELTSMRTGEYVGGW